MKENEEQENFCKDGCCEEQTIKDILEGIDPIIENLGIASMMPTPAEFEMAKLKSQAWERYKSYRDISDLLRTMIVDDPTVQSVSFEIERKDGVALLTISVE